MYWLNADKERESENSSFFYANFIFKTNILWKFYIFYKRLTNKIRRCKIMLQFGRVKKEKNHEFTEYIIGMSRMWSTN